MERRQAVTDGGRGGKSRTKKKNIQKTVEAGGEVDTRIRLTIAMDPRYG